MAPHMDSVGLRTRRPPGLFNINSRPRGWLVSIQSSGGAGNTQPAYQRSPNTWTFQASTTGTSWTTLDSETNFSNWAAYRPVSFGLSNTNAYTYYRLNVSVNGGNGYLGVQNLAMYSGQKMGSEIRLRQAPLDVLYGPIYENILLRRSFRL